MAERSAIWVSKEFRDELNKIRGKIMARTGRKPSWEKFLKALLDAYKKLEEGDVNERVD